MPEPQSQSQQPQSQQPQSQPQPPGQLGNLDRSHYLNRTLFECVETAAEQIGRRTPVCIATSCGKDSVATLDLCSRHFERLVGYFLYTVPDLSFQESYLSYLEKRYSFQVLRLPNPFLPKMFREGLFRNKTHRSMQAKNLKISDIEQYVRIKTGAEYVATGEKCVDSMERNAQLKRHGGIDPKRRRFYPIAFWNDGQVYAYLKQRGIHVPTDYHIFNTHTAKGRRDRNFVPFAEDHLIIVRERYPADYRRILQFFPYIESLVFKYEQEQRLWREQAEQERQAEQQAAAKAGAEGGGPNAV